MRYTLMRYTPTGCMPMRHMLMRCRPIHAYRYMPVKCTPTGCMPRRRMPYEMQALRCRP